MNKTRRHLHDALTPVDKASLRKAHAQRMLMKKVKRHLADQPKQAAKVLKQWLKQDL